MKKPARYRDVLAMLKTMARDERVSSDGLRAVLAGNIGEPASTAYTQADIARTRELAAVLGWELSTTLEPAEPGTQFDSPGAYQEEIRRLHAALRIARQQVKELEHQRAIGDEKGKKRNEQRRVQMIAAGVQSIDEAFERLEVFRAFLASHGECHSEQCGDNPALPPAERHAFIEAHEDICTCGAEQVHSLISPPSQKVA